MTILSDALEQLTDLARTPESTNPQALFDSLRTVIQATEDVGTEERDQALRAMADLVASSFLPFAAMISVGCGAMVERGCDPNIAVNAVVARLPETAAGAKALSDACDEAALDPNNPAHMQEIGPKMPDEANAWGALDYLYRAGVAMLSRSKDGRRRAKADLTLMSNLNALSDRHEGAGWLAKLVAVLDDEELIIIHPGEQRGYRVKISGIGGNFQLHTLLADALIGNPPEGWLTGTKPNPTVVAAERDENPPEGGLTTVGSFNLYNWDGLAADGKLREGKDSSNSWIWGEGVPADIRPFDGTRVILLGPPPYARSWNAGRMFSGMIPEFTLLEKLSDGQVQDWLKRIAARAV